MIVRRVPEPPLDAAVFGLPYLSCAADVPRSWELWYCGRCHVRWCGSRTSRCWACKTLTGRGRGYGPGRVN